MQISRLAAPQLARASALHGPKLDHPKWMWSTFAESGPTKNVHKRLKRSLNQLKEFTDGHSLGEAGIIETERDSAAEVVMSAKSMWQQASGVERTESTKDTTNSNLFSSISFTFVF